MVTTLLPVVRNHEVELPSVSIGHFGRPPSSTGLRLVLKIETLPCLIWFSAVAISCSAVAVSHVRGYDELGAAVGLPAAV
jgi:hypothetical protein